MIPIWIYDACEDAWHFLCTAHPNDLHEIMESIEHYGWYSAITDVDGGYSVTPDGRACFQITLSP